MTLTADSVSRGLSGSVAALVWRPDTPDDVRAYLDDNPDLRRDKEAVLDLAYEEYCRLVEAGQRPDLDEFCNRFPTYRASLRRVLCTHDYLNDNLHLLDPDTPKESADIKWPSEGETFLGFRLLRELGRGSFARVFLATQPELGGRLVALKVAWRSGNEAQILGPLDHPNVVKVHDARKDEPSGLTAVWMPYLGDATLENVLPAFKAKRPRSARVILDAARKSQGEPSGLPGRSGPADALLTKGSYVEGVCWLGAQIADALAFLHERKIYHRDLKPSNVLLCPDGRPMLLDFNLSADPQIERQLLGGTLPYMSPEQVTATFLSKTNASEPLDGRSDVFSLGVILFELLTGRLPFGEVTRRKPSEEECQELLARHRRGALSLRQLCPEATPALERLISRCLAFDRSQRPADAAEVAALLRRELAPLRRTVRRVLRHPWKLVGMAIALAALTAAIVVAEANQPTEVDRLVRAAEVAEQQGDEQRAVDLSDRALARAPENAKALLLSSRIYLRQGEYGLAERNYRKANLVAPDANVSACLAYSVGRANKHSEAIKYNEEAIARGFAPAEIVYNNLAYHQLAQSQRTAAEKTLNHLQSIAPDLPAAQHNRLALRRLELRLAQKEQLPAIRADMQKALVLCPHSAELFGDLADLCALASRLDAAWDADVLTYLEKAVALGLDLSNRPKQDSYRRFWEDPRFKALEELSAHRTALQPTARLLDPSAQRP